MLVDVAGINRPIKSVQTGIYMSDWWNFELEFRGHQGCSDLDWPTIDGMNCYGVCDSIEQLLDYLKSHAPQVLQGTTKYVISLVEIRKDHQSPTGGWRWHKWGHI